ncbi:MAG: tryptophan--tRNA ligase [Oscillospiraceae bacterium]|jgi:tryptophanyl-tRNA synthetase|nr:tryptophan--tRNA ligase [Oscillospiraceae bacterium]
MDGESERKIILSGIQPTSTFTLGNYIGAMKNWKKLQDENDCYYFLADLHTLTIRLEPKELRAKTAENFALLIACGLAPEKSLIFIQSQVPTHAEAGWILQCYTQFGELSRMTQFKDKSKQHPENINAGLFAYPSLMAADILLYQADYVPTGEDQKQHIEIARDIAQRFNGLYGEVFKIPAPYISKQGARIMSLADPARKMSKSDLHPRGPVLLLDKPEIIMRKFKSAKTDSGTEVVYGEGKDGINNLMTIYSCVTNRSFEEIEREFSGQGYGAFKKAVGEAVIEELRPIREEHERLMKDKIYLESCFRQGAEKAFAISRRTLTKMKKKLGLLM